MSADNASYSKQSKRPYVPSSYSQFGVIKKRKLHDGIQAAVKPVRCLTANNETLPHDFVNATMTSAKLSSEEREWLTIRSRPKFKARKVPQSLYQPSMPTPKPTRSVQLQSKEAIETQLKQQQLNRKLQTLALHRTYCSDDRPSPAPPAEEPPTTLESNAQTPRKLTKPLPVVLNSQVRAHHRSLFQEKLREEQQRKEAAKAREEAQRLEQEHAERQARKEQNVFRARPMPVYRPFQVHRSNADLTVPQAPVFRVLQRSRMGGGS